MIICRTLIQIVTGEKILHGFILALQYTLLAVDNGIEMTETLMLGLSVLVNVCQMAEKANLLQSLPLMIVHNRFSGRGDASVLDILADVGGQQVTVGGLAPLSCRFAV